MQIIPANLIQPNKLNSATDIRSHRTEWRKDCNSPFFQSSKAAQNVFQYWLLKLLNYSWPWAATCSNDATSENMYPPKSAIRLHAESEGWPAPVPHITPGIPSVRKPRSVRRSINEKKLYKYSNHMQSSMCFFSSIWISLVAFVLAFFESVFFSSSSDRISLSVSKPSKDYHSGTNDQTESGQVQMVIIFIILFRCTWQSRLSGSWWDF